MDKKRVKNKQAGESRINSICLKCMNYVSSAEWAYACYSKKCPSTNKVVKLDGWGKDRCRTPNWNPSDEKNKGESVSMATPADCKSVALSL